MIVDAFFFHISLAIRQFSTQYKVSSYSDYILYFRLSLQQGVTLVLSFTYTLEPWVAHTLPLSGRLAPANALKVRWLVRLYSHCSPDLK